MRACRLMILVLCACSSPAKQQVDAGPAPDAAYDIDEGAVSGTRLKLRYYDFGNVRELVGLHDSQLATNCTPTDWANGNTYCMPTDTESVVYSDANCTQPFAMAFVSDDCVSPIPEYYLEFSFSTCGTAASKLYRRGAPITRTEHYVRTGDVCSVTQGSPNTAYYALGAEVPVSELATLTLSAPSETGRLGVRYHESVDGLRYPEPHRIYDADLGPCTPYADAGATVGRCQPIELAYGGYFGDAACTQRLGTETAGCPGRKTIVSFAECPSDPTRYFAAGAKQTLTTVYSDDLGTCTGTPATPGVDYLAAGAEVTLVPMTRETKAGAERLQPVHLTTPEGLRTRDYGLFDTQLGTMCNAIAQSDGSIQCLPAGSSWITMYTDAGCTMPVDIQQVFRKPTCAEPAAPLFSTTRVPATTCTSDYRVRRSGPRFTGQAYRGSPGSCAAYNPTNFVLYRVGDAIAPGDLVTGTLVTAP